MGDAPEPDLASELLRLERAHVLTETDASDGELLRALLAMLPVGVVANDSGRIHYANACARQLLGVPTGEDIAAAQLLRYVDPQDWPLVVSRRKARMRGEKTPLATLRMRHADARRLVVTVETLDLRTPPAAMFLSVLHDVTEKTRLEEERVEALRQKEREAEALLETQKLESLGVLTGGIAHDFNNLLASVYASLSAITRLARTLPPPSRDALAPHVENAEAAAMRAAELTRQLLAYGGRVPVEKSALALRPLLDDLVGLLRLPMSKRIAFELDHSEHLPPFLADASQVRQVLMNLVTNAAEAIGDAEGRVVVTTLHRDDPGPEHRALGVPGDARPAPHGWVVMTVADDGQGMSETTRARIFEPFFSTKGLGRGLGLASTVGILRAHDARLALVSAPGRGSTFSVAFPALPSHAIPRFTACARSAPTRGPPAETTRLEGTVLLVDDEPRARFALSFLLRNRGLTILEAQDGLEAVEIVTARGATIDAVVMDLSMPKMGGREASVAMLARIPDLPIILTSGYSVDRLRGFPERDRILAFLEKPFHEEALVVWLERAFRLRRPADLPSITSP